MMTAATVPGDAFTEHAIAYAALVQAVGRINAPTWEAFCRRYIVTQPR